MKRTKLFSIYRSVNDVLSTNDLEIAVAEYRKGHSVTVNEKNRDLRSFRTSKPMLLLRGSNGTIDVTRQKQWQRRPFETIYKYYKMGYKTLITDASPTVDRLQAVGVEVPKRKRKKKKEAYPDLRIGSRIEIPHSLVGLQNIQRQFESLGKPTNITTLYHGTSNANLKSIIETGFEVPWLSGMLGRGVYLGKRDKASSYSDFLIFSVLVVLGRMKTLTEIESVDQQDVFDSFYAPKGTKIRDGWNLARPEWVVKNPEQCCCVAVIRVI